MGWKEGTWYEKEERQEVVEVRKEGARHRRRIRIAVPR